MPYRYDLQQDTEGALIVKDNDWVLDISDEQHVQDTINANPGWWKENFQDGVGIRKYQNSSGQGQVLARSIKQQLESDLYQVGTPVVKYNSDGTLFINPNATVL